MSVTIGMPSLKLNNVGRVGKHSGSFKKVAEEALAERRGRDADIDNSLTHENEIEGFKTAAELMEYSEKHIAELNAEIDKKNEALSEINKERKAQGLKPVSKIKHIRKDTVAMVSTIFKPPFEFMEALSQEQQRKFLKDCREIFGGIVGEEKIKSTAYHWDEICGHVHVFWEPMTRDGRLCAKDMHNIKFFNTVNRKVPQELRKRGWDIADCKMYDAAEEEEKMSKMTALEKREYLQERNARKNQSGRSSLRFKMEKNKQLDKEIKDKASKLVEVEKNKIFAESEYEILNENNNDLDKEIQEKEEKLSVINTEIKSRSSVLNIYEIYVDDGISGTERNRPDFQRMLKDCEEGKVDIVICKDQSRFSRDDTVIKEYLHEKFFIWHVRFIGVSDNVDSESPDFMDNSSLRGFFNEWYVRDISKKEKAANEILRKQGKYYRCAPYGYIKDTKDKHHLIPNPNTKDIVLRIFESYVGGMSLAKIAEMLNAEGIPSPTAYKKNIYPNYKSRYTDNVWSSDGIRTMLKNEAYIGNTTLGRSYKVSYRSKKKATIPKEQWVRHEGTHEPLISRDLWEMSRPRIKCPSRASSTTQEIPPLSGKLVCGCCGKYLVHRITGRKRKCDGEYVKYGYYRCPDVMKGKGTCENTRQISYLTLEKAVIEAINNAINAYCDKDKISIESMQAETIGFITKQYKQISDKMAKVQHRLDSIYTDKLDGLITPDEYVRYREQFNTELAELNTKLSESENKLTQLEQRRQNAEYCKSLAAKYTNITELTRQLTEDFVDSIVVGIADENGDREVNISLRV